MSVNETGVQLIGLYSYCIDGSGERSNANGLRIQRISARKVCF